MNENKTGKEIWSFNSGELSESRGAVSDGLKIETDIPIAEKETEQKLISQ